MTFTNLSDVQQALINARVIQQHWIDGGWEALSNELEEDLMTDNEVLDIYPLIEVDISVTVTIKLPDKIYSVPLEDVSPLSINDCLVIGVSDLYPDWEERVEANLETLICDTTIFKDDVSWYEAKYLGKDNRIRTIKLKATSITGYVSLT
jgi:hypothetical protein